MFDNIMIVCEHLRIIHKDNGWSLILPEKIAGSIGIFPGQNLFSYIDHETGRLLLSPLKLTSMTNYFRLYLDDVRGSLYKVTRVFSDRGLNILSGGAFGFSKIWVAEFLVDFADSGINPDEIVDEMRYLGGFVTSREITEIFPLGFNLESTFKAIKHEEGIQVISNSPAEDIIRRSDIGVVKAWPKIRAVFIDFFARETNLIHIRARIKDQPGSLVSLADVLRGHVNLNAVDEAHHAIASGEWNAYGEVVMGTIEDLKAKIDNLQTVISFEAKSLND
jgi:hypothetical protein